MILSDLEISTTPSMPLVYLRQLTFLFLFIIHGIFFK